MRLDSCGGYGGPALETFHGRGDGLLPPVGVPDGEDQDVLHPGVGVVVAHLQHRAEGADDAPAPAEQPGRLNPADPVQRDLQVALRADQGEPQLDGSENLGLFQLNDFELDKGFFDP